MPEIHARGPGSGEAESPAASGRPAPVAGADGEDGGGGKARLQASLSALRAENAALRRKADMLDAVLAQVPDGITIASAPDVVVERVSAHGIRRINRPEASLTGIGAERHPDAWQVLDGLGKRLLAAEELPLTRAVRRGETVENERLSLRLPDGTLLPILCNAGPIRDATGRITGGVVIWRDVTERARATEAVRQSEARLRALVEASSEILYRMNADWSHMLALEGRGLLADTLGPRADWPATYIPDEEKPRVAAAIAAAVQGRRPFELEHLVVRADGSRGWALSRAVPILDEAGEVTEWFGAASDVTERRQAEEQRKLLLQELNHRVKNTLATVQSIAMQTLREGCAADVRQRLQQRLISLARAHDVLTAESWREAGLREIARAALAPHGGALESGRIAIEGPAVRLGPKAALALALALHELATNAAKHGALSGAAGRVALQWRAEGEVLHLEWRESGGPPVAPPRRRGFGSRLLERGLVLELDARIERAFPPTGVVCTIAVPLVREAAPASARPAGPPGAGRTGAAGPAV